MVITSVTPDDPSDGGAGQFARTVSVLRRRLPGATIEVLISDLGWGHDVLKRVLAARPDIVNHNLDTVPRLYSRVPPHADYHRSLAVLARAKAVAPAVRYIPPSEFAWHEARARSLGYRGVAAGPHVRSSYRAEGLYQGAHPPARHSPKV